MVVVLATVVVVVLGTVVVVVRGGLVVVVVPWCFLIVVVVVDLCRAPTEAALPQPASATAMIMNIQSFFI